MGSYDNIKYECVCPVCHSKVDKFQSKSGECDFEVLNPSQAYNFYSSCDKCGSWIDFTAKEMINFDMTVTNKGKTLHTESVNINNDTECDNGK